VNILLVEPHHEHRARGNTTTARRWRRGLERRGHQVTAVDVVELDALALRAFDLVHAHHARHAGPAASTYARAQGLPFMISIGGTDLDGDLGTGPDEASLQQFRDADAVCGPFWQTEGRLAAHLETPPPFFRVRRGIELPTRGAPLRSSPPLRLLLAGAMRPVKGQDLALDWFEAARRADLPVELLFAGPALDKAWTKQIADRGRTAGGDVRWLGEVEPAVMPQLLAEIDVVINTSRHEGASNAILEGLAAGRPVLVRHAPGNTELVESLPREAGRLVEADDIASVVDHLREFLGDTLEMRRRRSESARSWIRHHHELRLEIDELEVAYSRLRQHFLRRKSASSSETERREG
jgi:glycosyltransferase involved in cell wall biosynthesis